MPTRVPRMLLEVAYEEAAREYQRGLPLEHYMEATPQATQRKISLESFDLVHARRPDIQCFSELLVQYPLPGSNKFGQVVPDNMIVFHHEPIKAVGSYNLPLQPVWPFCVIEYVSSSNARKDYRDNLEKYERDLKVPYYLLFRPELQELTLHRHNRKKYLTVGPNERARYAIAELELEVALLDGWMRYWFRGELLPLPGEMQRDLDEARHALLAAREQIERLQAELQQLKKTKKNGRPHSP